MTIQMPFPERGEALDHRAGFAAPHRLSPIERQVVVLARRDTIASLLPRRAPLVRALRLFGTAPANRFADPRLETLRCYAVLLRHGGDALAAASRRGLARAGYTEAQILHARWLTRQIRA